MKHMSVPTLTPHIWPLGPHLSEERHLSNILLEPEEEVPWQM